MKPVRFIKQQITDFFLGVRIGKDEVFQKELNRLMMRARQRVMARDAAEKIKKIDKQISQLNQKLAELQNSKEKK